MIKIIIEEAKKILVCIGVIWAILIGIFAAIGQLDYTVFLGLVLGTIFTLLSFALLGTTVEKTIVKAPKAAKGYMMTHYFIRFLLTAIVIYIGFSADYLNGICVCVPLFAPKLTYFSIGIYQTIKHKKGDNGGA